MAQAQLDTCARCGNIFTRLQSPVCPQCQTDEDADYEKVRGVLLRQPGLNAEQAAEAAGVALDCVLRMLIEGRVTNVQLGSVVKCGRCGAPAISVSKRLCEQCLVKLDLECADAIREIRERMAAQDKGHAYAVHQTVKKKRRVPLENRPTTEPPSIRKERKRRMAIQERIEETGPARKNPKR